MGRSHLRTSKLNASVSPAMFSRCNLNWREMSRREDMLGIAEKLPKSAMKLPKVASPRVAARRPIVALEGRTARKRH